jgi:hypothetical protein
MQLDPEAQLPSCKFEKFTTNTVQYYLQYLFQKSPANTPLNG